LFCAIFQKEGLLVQDAVFSKDDLSIGSIAKNLPDIIWKSLGEESFEDFAI